MMTKVKSAQIPAADGPATTIAIKCDFEPRQDNEFVPKGRPGTAV